MNRKPPCWAVAPALVDENSRGLWKGLAFVAPLWGFAGKGALLGPCGAPLAGANLLAGTGMQWRGSPYGLGVGRAANTNILYQDDLELVTTSNGSGGGDFTLVCLANPAAEAALSLGVSQNRAGATIRTHLGFNGNNNLAAVSGQFAFVSYDGAATSPLVAGGIDGLYHMFAGRRSGTVCEAWIDGTLRASVSGTVRDVADGNTGIAIGNLAEAATNRINAATTIVFAAAWNRALSDAEMRAVARDPFAMFRPAWLNGREWRWTPAGGAAVLSPSDLADELAFETPGFSQAHALAGNDAALAALWDGAGFLQSHLFAPVEMNFALPFELANLAMISQGGPPFRTRNVASSGRRENAGADARGRPVATANRSRTIME